MSSFEEIKKSLKRAREDIAKAVEAERKKDPVPYELRPRKKTRPNRAHLYNVNPGRMQVGFTRQGDLALTNQDRNHDYGDAFGTRIGPNTIVGRGTLTALDSVANAAAKEDPQSVWTWVLTKEAAVDSELMPAETGRRCPGLRARVLFPQFKAGGNGAPLQGVQTGYRGRGGYMGGGGYRGGRGGSIYQSYGVVEKEALAPANKDFNNPPVEKNNFRTAGYTKRRYQSEEEDFGQDADYYSKG
ncbi:hypothetical protein QBC44DRAFT_313327 [Cladorrhinum sp. PSN332]|nr:hypothetical protein QBC44DRAFT_313327 [Cladorrhinum sp. PSN332]